MYDKANERPKLISQTPHELLAEHEKTESSEPEPESGIRESEKPKTPWRGSVEARNGDIYSDDGEGGTIIQNGPRSMRSRELGTPVRNTEPFVDADASNSPRDPMTRFFEFAQFPEPMRSICHEFFRLAEFIDKEIVYSSAERTAAFRKLIESRECAIRATTISER